MSNGLMLPRHVHEQRQKQKAQAAAAAVSGGTMNTLESDDFVTRRQIHDQLGKLRAHRTERMESDPGWDLPKPTGWRLLMLLLTAPDRTDGGLELIDDSRTAKAMQSPQGIVLAMGPQAYKDRSRFTVDGAMAPWCAVGDRIMWAKYDMAKFTLANGQILAFMNDTQPMGIIDSGWHI